MKVVLVEDNPVTQMSLALYFKDEGFDVTSTVSYGEDVKQIVDQDKPDLLVLDIMLKGAIDGIKAAEHLRSANNPIPILFISALSDPDTMESIRQISNSDYITKPYDYEKLKQKMLMLAG